MRMTGGILITPARTSEILGCTAAESRRLLRDLGKEGHISPTGGECWEVTVKGKALASATAAKPLRRATGDRFVSEVLGRGREVNRDGQWAHKVETVDVACSLRPRWHDSQRQDLHEQERRELRRSRFASTIEWAYWPEFEVLRFLKSRS